MWGMERGKGKARAYSWKGERVSLHSLGSHFTSEPCCHPSWGYRSELNEA